MKTIKERLDALVARATKEEANRVDRGEHAIHEVVECWCLDSLEKSDDISGKGVIVNIPLSLIHDVPEWKTPAEMSNSLEEHFQRKVSVTPCGMDNKLWSFKLIVKSMP